MHLNQFVEKSQQFIEDHENEVWKITRIVTASLIGVLAVLLALMAYMTIVSMMA